MRSWYVPRGSASSPTASSIFAFALLLSTRSAGSTALALDGASDDTCHDCAERHIDEQALLQRSKDKTNLLEGHETLKQKTDLSLIDLGSTSLRSLAEQFRPLGVPLIYVASYRRTGTHLLQNYIATHLAQPAVVVKLNHVVPDGRSLPHACVAHLLRDGLVTFPKRNARDVVISMYYYMRAFYPTGTLPGNVSEFLAEEDTVHDIVAFYAHTMRSWGLYENVTFVPFKGLAQAASGSSQPALTHVGKMALERDRLRTYDKAVSKGSGRGSGGWEAVMPRWLSARVERWISQYTDMSASIRLRSKRSMPGIGMQERQFYGPPERFPRGTWPLAKACDVVPRLQEAKALLLCRRSEDWCQAKAKRGTG